MSSGVMKSRFSIAALARAILRNASDPPSAMSVVHGYPQARYGLGASGAVFGILLAFGMAWLTKGVAILKAAFRELDGAQGRVAHENELLEV